MPDHTPDAATRDYCYIAFSLMGALVEPEAALEFADMALEHKGYADGDVRAARQHCEGRMAAWGRG